MPEAKRQKFTVAVSRNGLREAILGLVAIKPMTGYDLSRSYRLALQQIWYAPLGQVYPTLRKMQRDGLLKVSIKVQTRRPNRKVYSLTPEGRKTLVAWLAQPAALPRMHHEFIHKLFQLSSIQAIQRAELVDGYIKRCRDWAINLRRAEAQLVSSLNGPNAESARFQLLSLQHLCRIVECEAHSAEQIAEEIRNFTAKKTARSNILGRVESAAFAGQSLSPTE